MTKNINTSYAFSIDDNEFLRTGVVRYKDNDGNGIFVKAETDGSGTKIKIRPNMDNVTVNAVYFTPPYDSEKMGGVEFTYNFRGESDDEINRMKEEYAEPLREIIHKAMEVVERWFVISSLLWQFNANNRKELLSMLKPDNPEEFTVNLLENIFNELSKFEEMNDLLKIYTEEIEK